MNNILEKLKKLLPYYEKYKKYILVSGLFVVMVVTLYFFTGEDFVANRLEEMNSKPVSGEKYEPDKEFEVDAYAELNELISIYFEAYVNADFETLDVVAKPISDMEKSYITTMTQYYEEYQNVKCYTKHGLSKNSYIVSARFDIKFIDQEEVAPSMVLFYVQTDENGELYINNLYSDFNMQYSELAINRDVFTALRKYTTQDDYLVLYNEVETAFNKLIKENEEIYVLTKRTIPAMRQEWEDTVYYAHEESKSSEGTEESELPEGIEGTSTEGAGTEGTTTEIPSTETPTTQEPDTQQPATEVPGTETPTTEEPAPQETESEETVVKVKVKSNNVNIRSEASKSSTKLGQVDKGTILVKLGEEGDWTKVEYDNQIGYIKTSLLEEVTE